MLHVIVWPALQSLTIMFYYIYPEILRYFWKFPMFESWKEFTKKKIKTINPKDWIIMKPFGVRVIYGRMDEEQKRNSKWTINIVNVINIVAWWYINWKFFPCASVKSSFDPDAKGFIFICFSMYSVFIYSLFKTEACFMGTQSFLWAKVYQKTQHIRLEDFKSLVWVL